MNRIRRYRCRHTSFHPECLETPTRRPNCPHHPPQPEDSTLGLNRPGQCGIRLHMHSAGVSWDACAIRSVLRRGVLELELFTQRDETK